MDKEARQEGREDGEEGRGTRRRLPKEQRRIQLMAAAHEIVRNEGTDALTLARVAERAGVTKPIAYEHFGTRAGLLIALYQDHDETQTRAMRAALQAGGRTLEDIAGIIATAWVDCGVTAGPEIAAITAALSGSGEMEELLQTCRDSFSAECQTAFAPFVREQSPAVMVAILGASEAISHAAATGRVQRDEAIATLTRTILGALR